MVDESVVVSPVVRRRLERAPQWRPWSAQAYAEARDRQHPLLLWVTSALDQGEDALDDPRVLALLDHYVPVIVDRVEHPEVDAAVTAAAVALTGRGGWPTVALLTPDGLPFFAATGLTVDALIHLLDSAADAWADRRDEVTDAAERITEGLRTQVDTAVGAEDGTPLPLATALDLAEDHVSELVDWQDGSFGRPPAVPPFMVLGWLLTHQARTGTERAIQAARTVGSAIAHSPLRDPLTGGFARFATGPAWTGPHPQWALPDNALALTFFTALTADGGSPWSAAVASETARFLLDHLGTRSGMFTAGLDGAGNDRHLWTPEQLTTALGEDDGATAALLLGSTEPGRAAPLARPVGLDTRWWEAVRSRLVEVRAEDPGPRRDESAVTAWNGLAVAALADAGRVLHRPEFVDGATAAAEDVLTTHLRDGRLHRLSVDGRVSDACAGAADHGLLAHGLQRLHVATGDSTWLDAAGAILETAVEAFAAPGGGFHDTETRTEPPLFVRLRGTTDVVEPGGSSALSRALLEHGHLTGDSAFLTAGTESVLAAARGATRTPVHSGWILTAAESLA